MDFLAKWASKAAHSRQLAKFEIRHKNSHKMMEKSKVAPPYLSSAEANI